MMGELGPILIHPPTAGSRPVQVPLDEAPHQSGTGVWKGRLSESAPVAGGPPYQVLAGDSLLCVVDLDREAVQAVLPPGLEPSSANPTGFVGIYHAPHGFGSEPYSGCFLSVSVQGRGISDDVPTFMKLAGWYSGSAARVMNHVYDHRLGSGEVAIWRNGRDWSAEGGPNGRPVIRLRMRQVGQDAPLTAGTHRAVGLSAEGGLSSYDISYSTRFFEAATLSLEIDSAGSEILRRLGPIRPSFCYYSPMSFLTFGTPQRQARPMAGTGQDTIPAEVFGLLEQLGRAAVIVGKGGVVRFANQHALDLLGDTLRVGRPLRTGRETDRRRLEHLAEATSGGNGEVERLVLEKDGSPLPVLARALRLGGPEGGDVPVVILLSNPVERGRTSKSGLLQLFGLSPAEARLALLVGMGHPPKEAALQANVTENTARSVLKTVFHKLGISRQADLVQLVTRLDTL